MKESKGGREREGETRKGEQTDKDLHQESQFSGVVGI